MSIDLFNAVKVYRNCEFVLTNAIYASTVARFSDIVLPVPSKWEGSFDHAEYAWPSGTVNRYYGVDFVSANYPVCEPMWECHSDDWISREIGARLGSIPTRLLQRMPSRAISIAWPVVSRQMRMGPSTRC